MFYVQRFMILGMAVSMMLSDPPIIQAEQYNAAAPVPASTLQYIREHGISVDILNEEWQVERNVKVTSGGFSLNAPLLLKNPLTGATIAIIVMANETRTPVGWIDQFRETVKKKGWRVSERRSDYGSENNARTTFEYDADGVVTAGKITATQLYPKLEMKVISYGTWPRENHDAMCIRFDAIVATLALIPGTYEIKKTSSW